jgi:hypothetical protein
MLSVLAKISRATKRHSGYGAGERCGLPVEPRGLFGSKRFLFLKRAALLMARGFLFLKRSRLFMARRFLALKRSRLFMARRLFVMKRRGLFMARRLLVMKRRGLFMARRLLFLKRNPLPVSCAQQSAACRHPAPTPPHQSIAQSSLASSLFLDFALGASQPLIIQRRQAHLKRNLL